MQNKPASIVNDNILVIGSSGFIGSCILGCLKENNHKGSVYTIDVEPDKINDRHQQIDISLPNFSEQIKFDQRIDTIVNLAAVHRDDVKPLSRYTEVNVEGAEHVCALARKLGVYRIVFTSSVAVYGFAPANTDVEGALNPFNEYGRTKAQAELVYKRWQAEEPSLRSLVIIRPAVVFGPGNRGNVYNLIWQVKSVFFVMIGNGQNIKSMAYVKNVSDFIISTLLMAKGVHTFNYVDKPDYDMNNLVGDVRQALGKSRTGYLRMPIEFGKVAGLIGDLAAKLLRRPFPITSIRVEKFCSNTQFASNAETIGFSAQHSMQQALIATVRHEFGAPN